MARMDDLLVKHRELGEHVDKALLALLRTCVENPEFYSRVGEVKLHLEKAVELSYNCHRELEELERAR